MTEYMVDGKKKKFEFTSKNLECEDQLKALKHTVAELSNNVGKDAGVLIFFSSYRAMSVCTRNWESKDFKKPF